MSDPRREVLRALELPRARRDGVWRTRTWDASGSGADDAAAPMRARRSGRAGRPPSFSTSNAATITLSRADSQEFTETGEVEFDGTTETRRAFAVPAFPAEAPSLPFGGVYSVYAEYELVPPVPAGTMFRLVDGAGGHLWRGDAEYVISDGWLLGDKVPIRLYAARQDWPAGLSPRWEVIPPDGGTVTVAEGARCTWGMEGTPAAGPTLTLPGIPTAQLLVDYDPEVQEHTFPSNLNDQSGVNNHWGGITGLERETNQVNGLAAWSGTAMQGGVENPAGFGDGDVEQRLWCYVVRRGATGATHTLMGNDSGGNSSGRLRASSDDVWELMTHLSGGDASSTDWRIVLATERLGDGHLVRVDGATVMSGAAASSTVDTRRLFVNRGQVALGGHWNGQVGRILCYSTVGGLPGGHIPEVENALSDIYGIAL